VDSATACNALAGRYLSGQGLPKDEKRDEKKAVTMYQRGCGLSADACVTLAGLSAKGTGGLSKDDKNVANYWLRGCSLVTMHDVDIDASSPIAQSCAKAGAIRVSGKGAAKDPARAYDDFTRACNRGDKPSCDQAKKIGPPPKK
jgi:TPR repeat protein